MNELFVPSSTLLSLIAQHTWRSDGTTTENIHRLYIRLLLEPITTFTATQLSRY